METKIHTLGSQQTDRFHISSDLKDDVWHADAGGDAYEWWYFDALSDDGREAIVIIFLANFIFSPRYNRAAAAPLQQRAVSSAGFSEAARFPAVAVCFYRDGRPVWRAINEYATVDFAASRAHPECRVGQSSFRLETARGGQRFVITLDEQLRCGRKLRASFAWEIAEGDLLPAGDDELTGQSFHSWNLVAPRCRVSGSYTIDGRDDRQIEERVFAGVGYHDHNRDTRWLPAAVRSWQWGRAHFAGTTAVFYCYQEIAVTAPLTWLFLIQDTALNAPAVNFEAADFRRHHFGIRYPRALTFAFKHEDQRAMLQVRQQRVIDGSYFYLRFLADARLELSDGRTLHAPAITEQLAPRALRWRWLDWLTDMRIGKHGRGSFLP
ncbi:MAG: hypothetical protein M3371_15115 [Acidobacteriota bacterium]|nr:hypothetical protein [Acidobacteriota bacterium]